MNNDINNIDTVGLHSSTDINNAPKTQADMDCICHTAATKIQRWLRYRMFLLSIYENTEYIFKLNEYISKPTQVNLFDVEAAEKSFWPAMIGAVYGYNTENSNPQACQKK